MISGSPADFGTLIADETEEVGERSAMAVRAAQDAGLTAARHIEGGLNAWKKEGGPLAR